MEFLENTLLEWQTAEEQVQIDRVLWGEPNGEGIWLIRITDPNALPRRVSRAELESRMTAGDLRTLDGDPFAKLHRREDEIPEKHRKIRDRAWQIIEPLLNLPAGDIFKPEVRARVINEICSRNAISRKTPYKYLRKYWCRGQTQNSLLPDYPNCGGRQKERRCSEIKRGRPSKTRQNLGLGPGINVGPEEKKKIDKGIKLFYLTDDKPSVPQVYQWTLERFFCKEREHINGDLVPIIPAVDERPTLRQFRYRLGQIEDPTRTSIARNGQNKFNLKDRPLLGDATMMAFGPGSIYQIDSTIADLWLVHPLDGARLVGRPILYLVTDVFTRLFVGFSLTLENPSYVSAMVALLNAAEDKVAFCAAHGISITPDAWPARHLPEMVVADRGELAGLQTDNLTKALNVRFSNTAPYRGDLKGIIERSFQTLNYELIHGLPGSVKGRKERGQKDPRLEAALNLQEFRTLLIHQILDHNRTRMDSYRLQDFLIAEEVEPIPNDLWAWGIRKRTGHLRQMAPDVLRLNLLPHDEGSVTPEGIYFRGVYYFCDRALSEQWFVRARQHRRWKVPLAYDPRNSEVVFLHLPGVNAIEPCQLLKKDARFKGCSWREIDDFFQWQNESSERFEPAARQSKAEVNAIRDRIVSAAEERSEAARAGLSKSARLRGARENREQARELDQPNQQLAPSPLASEGQGGSPSYADPGTTKSGNDDYIPAPSPLDKLRRKRDEKWSQNGK
jgi:putative transposase